MNKALAGTHGQSAIRAGGLATKPRKRLPRVRIFAAIGMRFAARHGIFAANRQRIAAIPPDIAAKVRNIAAIDLDFVVKSYAIAAKTSAFTAKDFDVVAIRHRIVAKSSDIAAKIHGFASKPRALVANRLRIAAKISAQFDRIRPRGRPGIRIAHPAQLNPHGVHRGQKGAKKRCAVRTYELFELFTIRGNPAE